MTINLSGTRIRRQLFIGFGWCTHSTRAGYTFGTGRTARTGSLPRRAPGIAGARKRQEAHQYKCSGSRTSGALSLQKRIGKLYGDMHVDYGARSVQTAHPAVPTLVVRLNRIGLVR